VGRLKPELLGPARVEERLQLQQPADDGGAASREVPVADVRKILPDGSQITGVGSRIAAEYGQVRVAEEGSGVVSGLRSVVRRQPHQPRNLVHLGGGQPRLAEPVLRQAGGPLFILAGDAPVDGVVEPGGQHDGARRTVRLRQQVKRLQDGEEVGAAVIAAVLFTPAVQQVQEERVVAGQDLVPAGQQRQFQ
jgi:hypothetical protein